MAEITNAELLQTFETKMTEFKSATTAEAQAAALREAKSIIEQTEKKYDQQIQDFNKELGLKGATLDQIVGEVKELKAKGSRLHGGVDHKSLGHQLADMILEKKDAFMKAEKGSFGEAVEIKTVANIATANLASGKYDTILDWRPGMEPLGQYHFRDIPGLRVIQSDTDFVKFPRANTPIGEGSFAKVAEGVTKPQVDRDWTMVEVTLTTLAGYAIVSRQSLRNIPFLQSWLPTSMMEQLQDQEDVIFAETLVNAATGSSTTTGVTALPSRLIGFIANMAARKYTGTGTFVVDPAVWAFLLSYRPGTDNNYGLPPVISVDQNGNVRVLGRTILPVNWLQNNRIIFGDWSKAAIVQSEGLTFRQTDSHASLFTSNEVCFLLERTENLAIFRPDAFMTTTVTLA